MSEPGGLRWIKSSYSGPTGANCVEVAALGDGQVSVRDSWQPGGPVLVFAGRDWVGRITEWVHVKTADSRPYGNPPSSLPPGMRG
jgi:Domain of unknown function (DUF397)